MEFNVKLLRTVCAIVLLGGVISGCASLVRPNYTQTLTELRSGAYSLDPEHAYLNFKIEHLGLSSIVGRFNMMAASLDFDPDKPANLVLEGVVDTASIDVNNASLENTLRKADWLGSETYPEAVFVSESVEPLEGNSFVVNGLFTLRDISKPIALQATFKGGADNILTGKYTLGFSATGSILRSDYGIDAFAALVADEVFIEIHGEFQRSDGSG